MSDEQQHEKNEQHEEHEKPEAGFDLNLSFRNPGFRAWGGKKRMRTSSEVVDFLASGATFSFRVTARRRLSERVRNRAIVSRDLAYTVNVIGGTGSVHAKLYSGGTRFSVEQTGEIGIDGNFDAAVERDAFGRVQPVLMERTDLFVETFTPYMTSVFSTATETPQTTRFGIVTEVEPLYPPTTSLVEPA